MARNVALSQHILKTRTFKDLLDTIANGQTPNTLLLDGSRPMGNMTFVDDASIFVGRDSNGTLPTADVSLRGKMIRVEGAAGVADALYICMKDALDAYVWVLIA